jgi:DNA-binding GntR family transcriptional regulator
MAPALLAAFRDNDVERANRLIRKHLEGSISQMTQQMQMLGF